MNPQRLFFGVALMMLAVVLAGCGSDAPPPNAATGRWPCPTTWVAGAYGGCGPAVLLCVPDGGAAPGACVGVDLTRPPPLALPDGGTVSGFSRLPDGGIGGGWPEPGDPTGPPDENWTPAAGVGVPADDWTPDAGLATCATAGACDPALRTDCPMGSAALPGGTCTPTAASDCPAGAYADPGPAALGATVVHVLAGSDRAAADGSTARPYATISDGVAHAGNGGWVLVAAGIYAEQVSVTTGTVHLLGVCAARVIVNGPGPESGGATLTATGADTVFDLRAVTLMGAGHGLEASVGAHVLAASLVLDGNIGVGVRSLSNAVVTLTGSVVWNTRPGAMINDGYGLDAEEGATLQAAHVVVAHNTRTGVLARGLGATMTLRDSVVSDTQASPGGGLGYGLTAIERATLTATGVVVVDNKEYGVYAQSPGTTAMLMNCVVANTNPNALSDLIGYYGRGLGVTHGATLQATNVVVTGNATAGVWANGSGTRVTVASGIVQNTVADPAGHFGYGLHAEAGALLEATDVLVTGNAEFGVLAQGADVDSGVATTMTLTGGVLRDTVPSPNSGHGIGVAAEDGAALTATRMLFLRNREYGVHVDGAGAAMTIVDSAVRDTLSGGGGSAGLAAGPGATLTAIHVMVDHNADHGIFATGSSDLPSTVTVGQSVVSNTQPHADGTFGNGIVAVADTTLNATGVLLDHNRDIGVLALRGGTTLMLANSVVRDTLPDRDRTAGYGVVAGTGATLVATGVLVVRNRFAGLAAFSQGTTLTVTDCVVRDTQPQQSDGAGGSGLAAVHQARVTATGVLVEHNTAVGVVAFDPGTTLVLEASAVRSTSPSPSGFFGHGLEVVGGARVTAAGVLLKDSTEFGLYIGDPGTEAVLTDVVVEGVRPSTTGRGFGLGLYSLGEALVSGSRLAIEGAGGAGIAAVPFQGAVETRLRLTDLLVRNIAASTIEVDPSGLQAMPEGLAVAYGLYSGPHCIVSATRVLLDSSGYGFYNANGRLALQQGVVARQQYAVGATGLDTPAGATTLADTAFAQNTSNAIMTDATLPYTSALSPPPPPCLPALCR